MKKTIANAKGSAMPKYIALLLVTATVFFACQKNAAHTAEAEAANDDLDKIAAMVNGDALSGSIATAADDKGISLVFNKGSRYVLIEKIPGMPGQDMNAIESAVLITSKYGVIVKDITANKVWLLANNDEESLQKFEAVKQQLHCSYVSTTIYGITVIKS